MRYLLTLFDNQVPAPQTQPLPGRPDQVRNAAGGYVWAAGPWTQLERFLILGSEGGTYYITEQALTVENAHNVQTCLKMDGQRVVRAVVEISTAARAPRNDPALFVLALAASPRFADAVTNAAALAALPQVARTATHLCTFTELVRKTRGWGRSLRSVVAAWYEQKPVSELAYQMVKYQNRNGWAHRDLMRLAHPKPRAGSQELLFRWAAKGALPDTAYTDLHQVEGYEAMKLAQTEAEVVRLIERHRLTHEMVVSRWKQSPAVWAALVETMPYGALVRQLAKLSAVGLLMPVGGTTWRVVQRLVDRAAVAKSRIHPVALLSAMLTYKQGRGVKGKLQWTPASVVIDALDEAFYAAFANVEPSGQRVYLALDASGSMQDAHCAGLPHVTPAMGSVAMAMAFARTEPRHMIAAFHEAVWSVDISAKDRLDRACAAIARESRGTDASLPMRDALARELEVDAFIVLTDNETWAGPKHPAQALQEYRQATGIPAKLAVVAMAANRYSIADPLDAGQLDVAGFDASVPAVLSQFIGTAPAA